MKDNNHSPVKTVSISGVLFDIQRQKHYVTTWCQATGTNCMAFKYTWVLLVKDTDIVVEGGFSTSPTGNKTPIFRTKKELLNEIFEDVNYYGKLSKS